MTRWLTPGLAAVDLTNPQSLNRYAYALNNPTTFVDPLGLCGETGTFSLSVNGTTYQSGSLTSDPCSPPPDVNCSSLDGYDCPYDNSGGYPYGSSGGNGGGSAQCSYVLVNPCGTQPSKPPQKPTNPANNGRNCTVSPVSASQYLAAGAQTVAMTAEFFSGLGPANPTFAPDSATSEVMAQSAGVQEVLNAYYMTGQTNGLYSFGLSGLVGAGGNPVAQFVGSFRWTITPVNGGINLSLMNTSSFKSLTYDIGPQWQRQSFPLPMGNTHQTYDISATCQ